MVIRSLVSGRQGRHKDVWVGADRTIMWAEGNKSVGASQQTLRSYSV